MKRRPAAARFLSLSRGLSLSKGLGIPLALLVLASLTPVAPVRAEAADWDVPDGHFFSQTGGYEILNRDGIPMWGEFQRLGGVSAVGYPASRRFAWDGYAVQVMQRVVFQWRPEARQVYFVNVFDLLTRAGKDEWLFRVRATPRPLPPEFDAGKPWDQVVAARLALLDENPAIKAAYLGVTGDPIAMNGLPTSRVTDMGNHFSLRAQRVVIQQWKENVPWANAGQVTFALGGDIAKEAGLLPAAALQIDQGLPPGLQRINSYRAAAGVAAARFSPALTRAAQNHVAYYDANRGDPSLAGMGLHREKPGAPGFTGASMGDRARAAGYPTGAVTENAGFGDIGRAIDWYMNTVNHRLPLIHPSALDIGYAASPASGFSIIDVGLPRDPLTIPLPSVYPPDGASGVPRSWDGSETPDPAPGISRPLGYPITVAFGIYQRVEWKSFQLLDPAGLPLEISTPRTDWMRAAAIIPLRPLQAGATYIAAVEAVVDGVPVRKQWRFTTG